MPAESAAPDHRSDDPGHRTAADIESALLQQRVDARADLATRAGDLADIVSAASDVATDDEHDPDGATIAFERAQVSALMAQAARRVADLDGALQRLDEGHYGRCEICRAEIGAERLEARPAARTCFTCALAAR